MEFVDDDENLFPDFTTSGNESLEHIFFFNKYERNNFEKRETERRAMARGFTNTLRLGFCLVLDSIPSIRD